MPTKKIDFAEVLQKCEAVVQEMGLVIQYTHNLDPFFKGDLDGKTIYIGSHLSPEEKVFNLLHNTHTHTHTHTTHTHNKTDRHTHREM